MTITVKRDHPGQMRHTIRIGSHSVTVDEPPANGGEDAGPTPHDLYDAALGACKALTLVWYARRKGMALRDIEIDIERDASREPQGVYRLRALLSLSGDLSDAEREQLLSVASRCPIHKLMTQVTTEVETAWK